MLTDKTCLSLCSSLPKSVLKLAVKCSSCHFAEVVSKRDSKCALTFLDLSRCFGREGDLPIENAFLYTSLEKVSGAPIRQYLA